MHTMVYAASILQGLFYVPQVRQRMASWRPPIPTNEEEVAPPMNGPGARADHSNKGEGDSVNNVQILRCGLSARFSLTWISPGSAISTWTNDSLRSISNLGTGLLNPPENSHGVRVLRHVSGGDG